jgi:hypothetical protein
MCNTDPENRAFFPSPRFVAAARRGPHLGDRCRTPWFGESTRSGGAALRQLDQLELPLLAVSTEAPQVHMVQLGERTVG